MNKVTCPLNPNSQGPALTDLHTALLYFLERGIFPINEEERQILDYSNNSHSYPKQ